MRIFVAAAAVLVLMGCTSGRSGAPPSNSLPARAPATGPVASTSPAATTVPANWPTYHGSYGRSGYSTTMPNFTGHLTVSRTITLDGAVYGSPIVMSNKIIVATENDTVYAFSLAGAMLWRRHLGTPASSSELPCGNIFPLGITGTPLYYNGLIYVLAEFSGNPPRHTLIAVRWSDGSVAWQRSVDASGVERAAMQQRGALALEGGRIWVPFGGLAGDCGGYKGRLVAVPANNVGAALVYTVPTTREAGIWTTPGPTIDAHGSVYASVGNGAAGPGDPYDFSDSVLKLGSTAHVTSYFAPSTWATDNTNDADLGSQGPALVGSSWVFIAGKSGTAYVLRQSALGGIGGQVSQMSVCRSFGGTAVVGSTVYVPCTDGLRAVSISSNGAMTVRWHAAVGGSPVVGGGRVWSLDAGAGVLDAYVPSTGAASAHISVGVTTRFATPALYGGRIIVPTKTGITIVIES